MASLSRQAAIVGAGRTTGFNVDGRSVPELLAEAAKMAIEDAGLNKSDIDGIITTQVAGFGSDPRLQYRFAEYMGFGNYSKVIDLPHTGGMSSGYANNQARWYLQQGLANYVLVLDGGDWRERYVGNDRDMGAAVRPYRESMRSPHPYDWEMPYGTGGAYSIYAPVGARHMYEFGTTSEQLAAISVACRKHATMNERACLRDPDHYRRRLELALDQLAAPPAGLRLHRPRLRHRLHRDLGGAGLRQPEAAGLDPRCGSRHVVLPRGQPLHPVTRGVRHRAHRGQDGGATRRSARQASRAATSTASRSTTASRPRPCSRSRTSASARRARAAPSSKTAASSWAASCRSTRTAACSPKASRATGPCS